MNTAITATELDGQHVWVEAPASYDVDAITAEDAQYDGQIRVIRHETDLPDGHPDKQ